MQHEHDKKDVFHRIVLDNAMGIALVQNYSFSTYQKVYLYTDFLENAEEY